MSSRSWAIVLALAVASLSSDACVKRGAPLDDRLNAHGYYSPRSVYENKRSDFGPEEWKEKFLLPREDEPNLSIYPNGTKILESCRTSPMFSVCRSGCQEDYVRKFTHHTGETCDLHSCNETLTCEGIHCQCCERINCTVQIDQLAIVSRDDRTALVENCTKTTLDYACLDPMSEFEASCSPAAGPAEALARVQTFLNASCSGPLGCSSFRRCSGLVCDCCQLLTCVLATELVDDEVVGGSQRKEEELSAMPDEDLNLLDLHRVGDEGIGVDNDERERRRLYFYNLHNQERLKSSAWADGPGCVIALFMSEAIILVSQNLL